MTYFLTFAVLALCVVVARLYVGLIHDDLRLQDAKAHFDNADTRIDWLARRATLNQREIDDLNAFIRAERQREEISE